MSDKNISIGDKLITRDIELADRVKHTIKFLDEEDAKLKKFSEECEHTHVITVHCADGSKYIYEECADKTFTLIKKEEK